MTHRSRVPELGARGEGWVALQFVTLAAIAGCTFVGVGQTVVELEAAGLVVCAGGLALLGLGIEALGKSLTPFPRPHAEAELRRRGIYRLVRHPIYGGVLLVAAGWSVAEAPLGLAPTALLAVVFALKSRREEAWLLERYPDYAGYRASTPHRFLPWLV